MWLRRGFFWWLLPAAIVLPGWLLVGWVLFGGSAWGLLGVLVVAAPAILVGELIIAMLIRARPTARDARAVSWSDALAITVWHGLVIAFGCAVPGAGFAIFLCAILAYLALFWTSLAQLLREGRGVFVAMSAPRSSSPLFASRPSTPGSGGPDVIVVHESGRREGSGPEH